MPKHRTQFYRDSFNRQCKLDQASLTELDDFDPLTPDEAFMAPATETVDLAEEASNVIHLPPVPKDTLADNESFMAAYVYYRNKRQIRV